MVFSWVHSDVHGYELIIMLLEIFFTCVIFLAHALCWLEGDSAGDAQCIQWCGEYGLVCPLLVQLIVC